MKKLAYLFAPLLLAACPDIKLDPGEGPTLGATDGPTVEFDPANSIVPFPNNLLLDPTTGKVNLPKQCNEGASATALREGVINKLDGFGAFETGIQITFTAPVDPTTLTDHVVMMQRTNGPDAIAPGTMVPVVMNVGTTVRYDATCTTPSTIVSLTIIPKIPLQEKSTFVVAVLDGVKTTMGTPFLPSFTWALVRQKEEPVGVDAMGNITANHTPIDQTTDAGKAQIKGIDLLWNAHAKAMAFLAAAGHDETTVDLAFEFTTQTVTDTLDPTVVGSPANAIVAAVPPVIEDVRGPAQTVLHGAFISLFGSDQCQQPDTAANPAFVGGGPIPCQAIGHIDAALIISPQYQTDTPNPLAGGNPVPGPFNDPIKPTAIHAAYQLQALLVVPDPAVVGPMPAGGWPTLVFGHGLGSSKESAVVIASQLANAGFQAIGIDFVAHGSRAILVDDSAADGCDTSVNGGTGPDPTVDHQCFAPPLSVDLGTTRDNIRQTVLDLQQVVAVLKACGPTGGCGALVADPSRIVYMGISLGGIIGSTTTAADPDIKEAVLNVAAVGLADILENSQTNDIRCPLVDALIDAGVLVGAKSNLTAMPPTGLCTTSDWSKQPGYAQFATIARWALDPCDGANFTPKLAGRKFLLQEVVGDQVVPNIATDDEGALTGLSPQIADMFTGTEPASAAITSSFPHNTWVRYPTLPAAGMFPGNAFQHASLLSPVPSAAGVLGTGRVQLDAITFLSLNK